MPKIGLIVDSASDLPSDFAQKNRIEMVPVKMDWPDLEPLPGANIIQKMREAEKRGIKSFGKTSQPSPKDFLEAYKRQLEKFDQIIVLTVTSKLSGTFNSAMQAKNILGESGNRIFVLDTLNATAGEALMVISALELIKRGLSVEEILKKLNELIPKINCCFFLEDPKWLEASGRISPTIARWMRSAQKIGVRPIIGIKDGLVKAVGLRTGIKDVPIALFKEFEAKTKKIRDKNVKIQAVIVHGDNIERAQSLKSLVEKNFKDVEISFINIVDDVLAVLCGPEAIIIGWQSLDF